MDEPTALDAGRHFTDVFDYNRSISVSSYLPRTGVDYLAEIRLRLLTNRTVVLTDAQFLCSPFFINAFKEKFDGGGVIATQIPIDRIEVRSRANGIEHTILKLFEPRGDSQHLNGFWIPAIDPQHQLQRSLSEVPASKVNSIKDLFNVINCTARSIERDGYGSELAFSLTEAWSKWIESKSIFRPWENQDHYTLRTGDLFRKSLDRIRGSVGDFGKDIIRTLEQKEKFDRTEILKNINREKIQVDFLNSADDYFDLEILESWMNSISNVALSEQHGCGSVDLDLVLSREERNKNYSLSDAILGLQDIYPSFSSAKSINVVLPETFMASLGAIGASTFTREHGRISDELENWISANPTHSPQALAAGLQKFSERLDMFRKYEIPNDIKYNPVKIFETLSKTERAKFITSISFGYYAGTIIEPKHLLVPFAGVLATLFADAKVWKSTKYKIVAQAITYRRSGHVSNEKEM